jgi:hypothetical protein
MRGFENRLTKNLCYTPCSFNGHKGFFHDSLLSKEQLDVLKFIITTDKTSPFIMCSNLCLFFPDVLPTVITQVVSIYSHNTYCNDEIMLKLLEEKKEHRDFYLKFIQWRDVDAKIAYEKGICIWNWLSTKFDHSYLPRIWEPFYGSGKYTENARMAAVTMKNIQYGKHRIFIMCCIKFLREKVMIRVQDDDEYICTEEGNEDITVLSQMADSCISYNEYMHDNYIFVPLAKNWNDPNIQNKKAIVNEWILWMQEKHKYSLVIDGIKKSVKKKICFLKHLLFLLLTNINEGYKNFKKIKKE